MSHQLLITRYLNELDRLRKISGTKRERVVQEAFKDLWKAWGKEHDLQFIPDYEIVTPAKNRIYPDGALLHSLRVPFGYWEAKDEEDDLDAEIAKKFKKGYPRDNIIFEDSISAALIQNGAEIFRCKVDDPQQLEKLLKLFFDYERQEIAEFRKAVEQFKTDLPAVLAALRDMIDKEEADDAGFREAQRKFLKHAKETINPAVTAADVREMLIQHILTEDIFAKVFNDSDFHRLNNVAKELYALEEKFFTGAVKKKTLKSLEPYYAAILATAALISTHSEKQAFLKIIYENFYKIYNPKAADRLGVIYTPSEMVRFMVESADWLCQKHFGKSLIAKNVEILDPATGTGTFICELLEHFRGQPLKLRHKYKEELHANEVAILPYYVANLNIEATYAAITGTYEEFKNLCFVDTLDNIAGLGKFSGYQEDMFGAMSEENVERIKRQNKRKISVIIGNPPYNANQQNENDNNKNRTYPRVDERIKATYIKESTAQKTKLYDMYARFFRWASDRIKDEGIVAFVTNRGFVDKRNFDGFRKIVARDFDEAWIIDLGGDYLETGSGGGGNVFGIGTGVAISLFVRNSSQSKQRDCVIRYASPPSSQADEKLAWLSTGSIEHLSWDKITPDEDGYWINLLQNDFNEEIALISKQAKRAKSVSQERSVFKLFSLGVATNRDDWVYDFSVESLQKKVRFFVEAYGSELARWKPEGRPKATAAWVSRSLKWTSELEDYLRRDGRLRFSESRIRKAAYRPYSPNYTYYDRTITHRLYQQDQIFPLERGVENNVIVFSGVAAQKPWLTCVIKDLPDLHYVGAAAGTVCAPRWTFTPDGTRLDNITGWALEQFKSHYGGGANPSLLAGEGTRPITKDAIFHYVYGVLHDPVYRE